MKLAVTTGVGTMNGSAATKAIAGRRPSRALTPRIKRTAASTLSRTSGIFRTAIEGRATQKNGATSQACAPSM